MDIMYVIYQPAKSAMQSGKRKIWRMESMNTEEKNIDPFMGWISSKDTDSQVVIEFDSKEEAIAFAKFKDMTFEVREPNTSVRRTKSYAENFKKKL